MNLLLYFTGQLNRQLSYIPFSDHVCLMVCNAFTHLTFIWLFEVLLKFELVDKTTTVPLSLCVRWLSNGDALGSGLEMRMNILHVANLSAFGYKSNQHCKEVADFVAIDFFGTINWMPLLARNLVLPCSKWWKNHSDV